MIEVHIPSRSPSLVGRLDLPLSLAFTCQALIFPTWKFFKEDLSGRDNTEWRRFPTRSIEDDDLETGQVYRTNVVIVLDPADLGILRLSGLFLPLT